MGWTKQQVKELRRGIRRDAKRRSIIGHDGLIEGLLVRGYRLRAADASHIFVCRTLQGAGVEEAVREMELRGLVKPLHDSLEDGCGEVQSIITRGWILTKRGIRVARKLDKGKYAGRSV